MRCSSVNRRLSRQCTPCATRQLKRTVAMPIPRPAPERTVTSCFANRTSTRVRLRIRAELTDGSSRVLFGYTENVSLTGFFFVPDRWLPLGITCQVTLRFAGPESPLRVDATARIVRSTGRGLALAFAEISAASLPHLQNLVRYNAGNPGQIEREFERHVGIRPADLQNTGT